MINAEMDITRMEELFMIDQSSPSNKTIAFHRRDCTVYFRFVQFCPHIMFLEHQQ